MNRHNQNLKTDNLIRIITKGGVIVFLGSIIGKILRFVFAIILTRILGAALYGLYVIGQSIIDVATNIGLLGDGWGFISMSARFLHDKDTPRLKGSIIGYLLVSFLLSIFISALLFFSSENISVLIFHHRELTGVLKIFSVGFPLYVLSLATLPVSTVFQRMEIKVILQEFAQPAANILVIIAVFIFGGRLYGAVIGFVISSFLTAILGLYLLKKVFPEITSSSLYIIQIKKMLKDSLPIMGIFFCFYLFYRLDRIMLGVFRSPYEVGIYSAASNTAMCVLIFTGMFEASFSPIIAQLYHGNKREELRRVFSYITFIGAAIAFIPCIALIIFSSEIISLFGSDFKIGNISLIILSLTFFLDIIPGKLRQLFQMSSRQNVEFLNSLIMIALNFSLNILLIPILGINGAALSAFFSIGIVSVVRTIELKLFFEFLPFSWKYMLFLTFAVSTFLLSFLFVVNGGIYLKTTALIVLAAIFFTLIFKLKSEEDIILWRAIKSKFLKT